MTHTKIYVALYVVICVLTIGFVSAAAVDDFTLWNQSVLIMSMEGSVLDSSPRAVNPTILTGSPTLDTDCYIGQCYTFDGNDAWGEQQAGRNITNNFLTCAWLNTTNSIADYGTIWGVNDGGQMIWRSNYEQAGTNTHRLQSGANIAIGTQIEGDTGWNFYCAGQNTTHLFVYENGAVAGSTGFTTDIAEPATSIGIGANYETGTPVQFFTGKIDEFYHFNTSFYQPTYTYSSYTGTTAIVQYLYAKTTGLGNSSTTYAENSITLTSPTNTSTLDYLSVNVTFIPVFNTTLQSTVCNITTNASGTWATHFSLVHQDIWGSAPNYFNNNSLSQMQMNLSADGSYLYGVTCTDVDLHAFSSQNKTVYIDRITEMVTYDNPVYELSSQTIYLNITTQNSISNTNATFFYNGSEYNTTKSLGTTNVLYSAIFITPIITSPSNNISFLWEYSVVTTNESTLNANITGQQTVSQIGVDNCSVYTFPSLNFSMFVDDTFPATVVNSTLNGYFQASQSGQSDYRPFNLSWASAETHAVCISNQTANYSVYAQVEFGGFDTFTKKTYYLTDAYINNETQYINLYLSSNTSQVAINVQDQDGTDVSDAYVHILRYNFATNSYVTSEIVKSDGDGNAIGNIVLVTDWYKFIVYKSGAKVLETDPLKILTQSQTLRVNLLIDYTSYFRDLSAVTTTLTFNNITNNFVYTFSNPTGLSKTACLYVTQRTSLKEVEIGNSCSSSASGTILVNIGDITNQSGTYVATGTIQGSPEIIAQVAIWEITETAYRTFGKDGIFMMFFLRLTIALIGIWNPIVAIILLILGDVAMGTLGFVKMSWDFLVVYIILAFITIWKIGRRS